MKDKGKNAAHQKTFKAKNPSINTAVSAEARSRFDDLCKEHGLGVRAMLEELIFGGVAGKEPGVTVVRKPKGKGVIEAERLLELCGNDAGKAKKTLLEKLKADNPGFTTNSKAPKNQEGGEHYEAYKRYGAVTRQLSNKANA
ncbi:hypothetical protein KI809_18365 [Geobacter pelophilus]|uniref:Uncharacterized protein n=1 Tax=Geoanaerobacter pelophilus TaxID=60036 RepID=A0AAW4LE38_9BACT|nr:hypothetical protein [Geoanaerobacter pelophilus]MBT0666279.1 hypothetical protein [Geoanaerobacter pelophilus]